MMRSVLLHNANKGRGRRGAFRPLRSDAHERVLKPKESKKDIDSDVHTDQVQRSVLPVVRKLDQQYSEDLEHGHERSSKRQRPPGTQVRSSSRSTTGHAYHSPTNVNHGDLDHQVPETPTSDVEQPSIVESLVEAQDECDPADTFPRENGQKEARSSGPDDLENARHGGERRPPDIAEKEQECMPDTTNEQQLDLRQMLKTQEEVLKSRNNELFHERADIFQSPRDRGNPAALLSVHSMRMGAENDSTQTQTYETRWKAMIDLAEARDPRFFTGDFATMATASSNIGKGVAAYAGLKVNRHNCVDVNEIYTLRFRTKELMNMSSEASFKLLQSIVGQFMR